MVAPGTARPMRPVRERNLRVWMAAAAALLAAVVAAGPLVAETTVSVTTTAMAGVTRLDDAPAVFGAAQSTLSVDATGNRNVRGSLQLRATVPAAAPLDVVDAYIKFRLPGVRSTIGVAPISWGRGISLNAANVVFAGASAAPGDISGGDIGSILAPTSASSVAAGSSALQLEAYVPLGQFSFAEALALPYPPGTTGLPPIAVWKGLYGARFASNPLGIDVEGGYVFDGGNQLHRPYLALQFHAFFDWYASASSTIPQAAVSAGSIGAKDVVDSATVTAGLFRSFSLPGDRSLSVRVEGELGPQPSRVLLLAPEITLALSPTLAIHGSGTVSMRDASALISAGTEWNVYEGFTAFAYGAFMVGRSGDIYGGARDGGQTVVVGARFVY